MNAHINTYKLKEVFPIITLIFLHIFSFNVKKTKPDDFNIERNEQYNLIKNNFPVSHSELYSNFNLQFILKNQLLSNKKVPTTIKSIPNQRIALIFSHRKVKAKSAVKTKARLLMGDKRLTSRRDNATIHIKVAIK